MIISRTPLRLSLFGGGSDYPVWYQKHGGAVLGTTIDKYCYVSLHAGRSWDTYDLPTKSGLATSSAYTVGLLRVCSNLDTKTLAAVATLWEQEKLSYNVGSQDQYLCAMGGFRKIMFDEHGIRDKLLEPEMVAPLQDRLMLFDTHQRRISGDVIASQLERITENERALESMMAMVHEAVGIIQSGKWPDFGALLDEGWELKKSLSAAVSTPEIDRIYGTAKSAGATGGKLLGAGGGGFILFFVEPDKQESVKAALENLTHVPFEFETAGTEIIYSD